MVIGWIEVLKKVYGETIYNQMAQSILSRHHNLEVINVGLDQYEKYLYPKILYRLCRLTGKKSVWVRNFDSVLTLPYDHTRGKNIALIFHIDFSSLPRYLRPLGTGLGKIFYRHLKNVDALVTISKYWQDHFMDRGYPNVHLIYNAFDTDQFHFDEEEILKFRETFQLGGKPILYLGNCQRIKGVVEAYSHLKGLDAHLVTSGRKEVDLPTLHLNLTYRDYLLLLKSSSVVITMSKFKEGWNRTAHEAMLCKTPVIGSGQGGMRELLEGGRQIICEDFNDLKEKVLYALTHPESGGMGYPFAKEFTVERSGGEWLKVMQKVYEG